ncbi:helix-turn-helix domain-containing protein [Vibrio jasicida]|uniref:helix-turn-helix domain-containing protein n=1 Tax=Vibrio jasicida TaxID=766224 RepID=UPI004067FAEA
MFGDIIRSFRKQNGLSQLNFVNSLQKSSENFNNLDVVTLSRWERGATTPHLNRQNEILDILGVDVFDVWRESHGTPPLPAFTSRLSSHGYFDDSDVEQVEILVINSTNVSLLDDISNYVNVILDFEDNVIFKAMSEKSLTKIDIVKVIITRYGGELTIVSKYEQILGHSLSANYNLLVDFVDKHASYTDENVYFILSFNSIHTSSLVESLGREVYRYIHSLNPDSQLVLYVKNQVAFDLFFSLGFEYRSFSHDNTHFKLMKIDKKSLKSKKDWMNIISQYKGKYYD